MKGLEYVWCMVSLLHSLLILHWREREWTGVCIGFKRLCNKASISEGDFKFRLFEHSNHFFYHGLSKVHICSGKLNLFSFT